jgi:hypothetical protein
MLLCPSLSLAFVHVPKTGGSSLTEILSAHTDPKLRSAAPRLNGLGWQGTWHFEGRQHATYRAASARLERAGCDIRDWHVVTIAREPLDWLLSVWQHVYATDKGRERGQNWMFGQQFPQRTFSDFIQFIANNHERHPRFWGLSDQASFTAGVPDGKLTVINFHRYESDILKFCASRGVHVSKVPHLLRNRESQLRKETRGKYLEGIDIEFARKVFARDFAVFEGEWDNGKPSVSRIS